MRHFFDVGANVGQTFSDYICGRDEYDGCTVWCFEPSPRHLPELIERTKAYTDRYKIKICPFGLWDSDKIMPLFEKDDPLGDSFDEQNANTVNLNGGYELLIPVLSIAKFIGYATEDGDEITLKIDAEGAEYPMLNDILNDQNGAFKRLRKVMVEWHTGEMQYSYTPREITIASFLERGLIIENWI